MSIHKLSFIDISLRWETYKDLQKRYFHNFWSILEISIEIDNQSHFYAAYILHLYTRINNTLIFIDSWLEEWRNE